MRFSHLSRSKEWTQGGEVKASTGLSRIVVARGDKVSRSNELIAAGVMNGWWRCRSGIEPGNGRVVLIIRKPLASTI